MRARGAPPGTPPPAPPRPPAAASPARLCNRSKVAIFVRCTMTMRFSQFRDPADNQPGHGTACAAHEAPHDEECKRGSGRWRLPENERSHLPEAFTPLDGAVAGGAAHCLCRLVPYARRIALGGEQLQGRAGRNPRYMMPKVFVPQAESAAGASSVGQY